ncbi:MAG: Hsp20/alpha crystallin family protein [Verrucomicrobia bacterium]|nr:Hsp20/alpha crystallin family protein [Verrucomicrobiota bacterium]
MERTIRTQWFRLGALLALGLAVVALALPSLCGGATGDEPDKQDADQGEGTVREDGAKDRADKDDADFRIELDKLEGEDLDKAIDAQIEEMRRRIEELERDMDEMTERRLREPGADDDWFSFPGGRGRVRVWRDGDQFDRPIPPEIEEMLKRVEEQWPEELRRRLERRGDLVPGGRGPEGSGPFQFRMDLGPGEHAFSLRMDTEETDKAYVYRLDMPGMEKDAIVVEVEDNVLTISGERNEQVEEEKDGQTVRREIVYGSFTRAVTLPGNADAEAITSKYDNGVLTITVPKKEHQAEEESRRIIVHQP